MGWSVRKIRFPRKKPTIADRGRNPLDRLPLHKRVYVAARVAGDTVKQASESALIAPSTGGKLEKDKDIQQAYQYLIRQALPSTRLVELIAGGCEANTDIFDSQGNVKRTIPDWKTRRGYIEMAVEQGGYFEKKEQNNATLISVSIENIGQSGQGTKHINTIAAKAIVTESTNQ